jgi:hypothetical protein
VRSPIASETGIRISTIDATMNNLLILIFLMRCFTY